MSKSKKTWKRVWKLSLGKYWLGVEVGFVQPVSEVNTAWLEISWGRKHGND